ncbi:MAG: Glu/Leu/Phe/Val dehydrogenase dimerization domain-containing protein [Thermoplasmata archaeon]
MSPPMAVSDEFTLKISSLNAHVVVDCFVHDLAGGGLRFSPSVDLPELRRLARTMTHKWAMLELPFGGCKLGIQGDPSRSDKTAVLREFAVQAKDFLRDRVFTGPDMGTTPADLRTFFGVMGQDSYDVVAKRLSSMGYRPTSKEGYRSIMRSIQGDVTGVAVARAAERAWKSRGGSLNGATVSIQGFGSVGRAAAEELIGLGARVVCIGDELGCLWNARGLDATQLGGPRPGIMKRSPLQRGTEERPGDYWLDAQADILVPAAIADAINWENVSRVDAKMVVEGANIPVPEDVEAHLHERDVLVLPDFVVNAGLAAAFGVLLTDTWEGPKEVLQEVLKRIVSSTAAVVDGSLHQERPPREVAVELAMSRLRG